MERRKWRVGCWIQHSIQITLLSLLVLTVLSISIKGRTILYKTIHFSYISAGIDIFVLSLLHSASELLFTFHMRADVSTSELKLKRGETLDMIKLLTSVSTTVSKPFYLQSAENVSSLCDLEKDSIFLIVNEIERLQIM